jgi:hypothetical protein
MIKSIDIKNNKSASKDKKRLQAIIYFNNGKSKTVKFGQHKSKGTFLDGANNLKREAYLSRHSKMNENWNNIETPGALSRWVLWEFNNIKDIQKFIKNKFNIPIVKIDFTKYKIKY